MDANEKTVKKQIDFLNILKVSFHRRILLSIITASTLVIGTLGLYVINRSKAVYKSSFNFNIPSIINGKYLNGASFNFQDIVSKENIEYLINSDDSFKNINIKKIYGKSEIKHIKEYSSVSKEVTNEYYTLTLPKHCFSSKEQAEDFIDKMISYPIRESVSSFEKLDYKIYLENYNYSETYEDQITNLTNQYNFLLSNYDNIKKYYGNITYEDKSITVYENELKKEFVTNPLKDLSTELKLNGYMKNITKELNSLNITKKDLEKTIKYNEQKIDNLKEMIKYLLDNSSTTQSLDIDSYNEKISALITENIDLQKEIDDINIKIANSATAPDSFITELDKYKDLLSKETDVYLSIEKYLIENHSKIEYKNSVVIEEENGDSILKYALISLIGGLMIGCIVNLIIDRKYLIDGYPKKEELPVSK